MGYSTLETIYYKCVHFYVEKRLILVRDFGTIGNSLGRLASGFLYRSKGWKWCLVGSAIINLVSNGILTLGIGLYIPLPAYSAWICSFLTSFGFSMLVCCVSPYMSVLNLYM